MLSVLDEAIRLNHDRRPEAAGLSGYGVIMYAASLQHLEGFTLPEETVGRGGGQCDLCSRSMWASTAGWSLSLFSHQIRLRVKVL